MKSLTHSNPFGLLAFLHWNHDWNNYHFPDSLLIKAVNQIRDLGVGIVRMDILWSDVYNGYQKYNFERYDRIISLLFKNNINVLALLHYNKAHSNSNKEVWNHPPDSFDEFAHYVGATVAHFKGFIHHWEIWNEPNHPVYWAAPKDGLKRYTELLRVSYQAAKRSDPACTVLNGGITQPLLEDLTNFYRQNGKNWTDILSIHTFIDPLSKNPEKEFDDLILGIRNIMTRYEDGNKNIWITEMGCPGIPAGIKNHTWFQGEGTSEDKQAEWVRTQYRMAQKHPSIQKIFWAFYRDTGNMFNDATDHLGLVRFDLSPKPAFEAFKKLIEE